MPYLPNEAAQRATNYGWMNPTHRRSHHTILVNLLQNPWYGILCPIGKSSVKLIDFGVKIHITFLITIHILVSKI